MALKTASCPVVQKVKLQFQTATRTQHMMNLPWTRSTSFTSWSWSPVSSSLLATYLPQQPAQSHAPVIHEHLGRTRTCLLLQLTTMLSVLWHGWLGIRKSIGNIKNWAIRCWCGYLSGARCRLFAYGSADATASQNWSSLVSFKSRLVLPFWYWLTQVVLENRQLNGCSSSSSSSRSSRGTEVKGLTW